MKKPSYAELQRKIIELESQLVHRYAFASKEIDKASVDRLMASGAVITISALGGRVLVEPVCIRDGLSNDTIKALKADLLRSYELANLHKPLA